MRFETLPAGKKCKFKIGDVVEFRKIEGPVMVINSTGAPGDEVEVFFVREGGQISGRYIDPKLLKRVKK